MADDELLPTELIDDADEEQASDDGEIRGYCRCGADWTGEAVAHCATCHLTFTSPTGFDRHRRGPVGSARCLVDEELRTVGLEPNEDGHWRVPMSDADHWTA